MALVNLNDEFCRCGFFVTDSALVKHANLQYFYNWFASRYRSMELVESSFDKPVLFCTRKTNPGCCHDSWALHIKVIFRNNTFVLLKDVFGDSMIISIYIMMPQLPDFRIFTPADGRNYYGLWNQIPPHLRGMLLRMAIRHHPSPYQSHAFFKQELTYTASVFQTFSRLNEILPLKRKADNDHLELLLATYVRPKILRFK